LLIPSDLSSCNGGDYLIDLCEFKRNKNSSTSIDVDAFCDKLFNVYGAKIFLYISNALTSQLGNSSFAKIDMLDCECVASSICEFASDCYVMLLLGIAKRIKLILRKSGFYVTFESSFPNVLLVSDKYFYDAYIYVYTHPIAMTILITSVFILFSIGFVVLNIVLTNDGFTFYF